jgi:hypothetical protein
MIREGMIAGRAVLLAGQPGGALRTCWVLWYTMSIQSEVEHAGTAKAAAVAVETAVGVLSHPVMMPCNSRNERSKCVTMT